jgi:hypothetical protein
MVRDTETVRCRTSPTPSPKAYLIPSEAESPRWKQRGLFLPVSYYWVMNQNDDKLSALLKRWRDIEPRGNFEANVWRQIRAATEPTVETVNWIDLIGRLLWQPAWSVVAAMVVALIVGVWGGIASVPRQVDRPTAELRFLSPGTLAGSYTQMASKGAK